MLNRLVEASLRYKFLVLIAFGVVAFLGWRAVLNVPMNRLPATRTSSASPKTTTPWKFSLNSQSWTRVPRERSSSTTWGCALARLAAESSWETEANDPLAARARGRGRGRSGEKGRRRPARMDGLP